MLALLWGQTPAAGSEAGSGFALVAAVAPALKAAPVVVFGRVPVDLFESEPASAAVGVAAPALRAVNGPSAAPASASLPPAAAPAVGAVLVPGAAPASPVALSALERSGFVPASAALAAPVSPLEALVAETVAAPGPGSAEPVAGNVAALGLPGAQVAALESVSASVLSSGPVAEPWPVAALESPSRWAPLSYEGSKDDQSHISQKAPGVPRKAKFQYAILAVPLVLGDVANTVPFCASVSPK